MLVVDASALVELLLLSPLGARIADHLGDEPLHAPEVLDLEVTSVVNRLTNAGKLTQDEATDVLATYVALGIIRHPHEPLLGRIHALRENLAAYDAAYIALSEGLEASLLTCDTKLGTAPGHGAEVYLIV